MCVVSMIHEHYSDRWGRRPMGPYEVPPPFPFTQTDQEKEEQLRQLSDALKNKFNYPEPISREEIEEFRELMRRAREYDKKFNQPDCPSEDKSKKLLATLNRLGLDQGMIDEIMQIATEN
jgi:hypothetical protein